MKIKLKYRKAASNIHIFSGGHSAVKDELFSKGWNNFFLEIKQQSLNYYIYKIMDG
jgi:hypothetical protein